MLNYYEILGVDPKADTATIKSAFKTMAKKYHPDISKEPDAEEKFKQINEAHEVLSDPNKRSQYDMQLNGNPFGGWGAGFPDIEDFFGRNRRPQVRPNSSIQIEYHLELDKFGKVNEIEVNYYSIHQCKKCNGAGGFDPVTCPRCQGKGMINHTVSEGNYTMFQSIPCEHCGGKGKMFQKSCDACDGFGLIRNVMNEKITLPIDCAWRKIALRGKGNQENPAMPPGDLIVIIIPQSTDKYRIENHYNVVTSLELDPVEAMLGGEFKIESFDGKEHNISVPEGCREGYREVVKECGIPVNEFQKGSFVVEITYRVPNNLSVKQKNALKKYIKLRSEENDNDND